ncbi:hypothetical protein L9F63_022730, partial [Diploptera punctata]
FQLRYYELSISLGTFFNNKISHSSLLLHSTSRVLFARFFILLIPTFSALGSIVSLIILFTVFGCMFDYQGSQCLPSLRLTRVLFPGSFSEFSFSYTLINTHTWSKV